MKKRRIEMTAAEIINAIANYTMTVDEVRETVTRYLMTMAEIEAEAADWWGADWTAEDIEEIAERYEDEYGIKLTAGEKEDLEQALMSRALSNR